MRNHLESKKRCLFICNISIYAVLVDFDYCDYEVDSDQFYCKSVFFLDFPTFLKAMMLLDLRYNHS
jgi:hypothetical protein